MKITAQDLFTRAEPDTLWKRIIHYPLLRVFVALLFLAPAIAIHNLSSIYLIEKLAKPWSSIIGSAEQILSVFLILFFYSLFVRRVEMRPPLELSREGAFREFLRGWLLSFTMVASIVLLLSLLGYYRILGTAAPWTLLSAFVLFTVGAFVQVIFFRLILFRLFEEIMGTWIACALIAILFGFAHMGNDNASLLSLSSLAITDILLIGAFILTRRLWFVWGIHAAWNFVQDGVFGMPNSGITTLPSWIESVVSGPDVLSGGAFGIESSLPGVLMPLIASVVVLRLAVRRKQIVGPQWRRRT